MKLLKSLSFCLLGIVLLILIVATVLEKVYGTHFVNNYIYGSVSFVALWIITAVVSILYMLRRRLQKQPITFLLHLSLIVILAGAFITYLYSERGSVHLRQNRTTTTFITADGCSKEFPFMVKLDSFRVVYYTGTQAPMDFVSAIAIVYGDEKVKGKVAMNRIFSHMNYRFYQSGYDDDGKGSTLIISHDPYGIAVTYTGYTLLLLSLALFFFTPHSYFRQLIKSPLLRRGAAFGLLLLCPHLHAIPYSSDIPNTPHASTPKVLPRDIAARFGDLYILYNDRVCPVQTLAKDFTVKLYGRTTYHGFTAEQVLTGWLFFYSNWKDEPIIEIKSAAARTILGIEGRYASLQDYINSINEYKLDPIKEKIQNSWNDQNPQKIRNGESIIDKRGIEEADEKFNIVNMLCSGKLIKIYPHHADAGTSIEWYAQGDLLPRDMKDEKWFFIKKSLDYMGEMVVKKEYNDISFLLGKIKAFQCKECGDLLPSDAVFNAEKLYNRIDYTRLLSICCIIIGLLTFVFYCRRIVCRQSVDRLLIVVLNILLALVLIYLSTTIGLRGYVSNHLPLSSGYETMQFMAWCTLLLTVFFQRRFSMSLPFGFLLCGLALMVSMLGESNPKITQLMPVLASPLLCIHVMAIMIAYTLLAFMMLNGITAIVLCHSHRNCVGEIERLSVISRIMLYPAVFFLAVGIFMGAVWANVSWGRYWGWDPKEVWALITLLIYVLALHPGSLTLFRRPMFFHIFSIVAFLSVLITYFGVNFLLGGMHSYAGG